MKELKEYIHLYQDCPCFFGYEGKQKRGKVCGIHHPFGVQVFDPSNILVPYHAVRLELIKLILRPLESMTDEEVRELIQYEKISKVYHSLEYKFYPESREIDIHYVDKADGEEGQGSYSHEYTISFMACNAHDFAWLLSKGFDLFGLKDAGLAIYENDKT